MLWCSGTPQRLERLRLAAREERPGEREREALPEREYEEDEEEPPERERERDEDDEPLPERDLRPPEALPESDAESESLPLPLLLPLPLPLPELEPDPESLLLLLPLPALLLLLLRLRLLRLLPLLLLLLLPPPLLLLLPEAELDEEPEPDEDDDEDAAESACCVGGTTGTGACAAARLGAFCRCSRKPSVRPPSPMAVQKLMAKRVFLAESLGKSPSKDGCIAGSARRSLSCLRPRYSATSCQRA